RLVEELRMTNPEYRIKTKSRLSPSSHFVIRISFGLRHSGFVISINPAPAVPVRAKSTRQPSSGGGASGRRIRAALLDAAILSSHRSEQNPCGPHSRSLAGHQGGQE